MENETSLLDVDAKSNINRGGCLTSLLVFMIIANAASALIYLLNPGPVIQQYPRLAQGFLLLFIVALLLNIVLAILVWKWRRVGVYGCIAIALIVFPINLYVGIPVLKALTGFLGPLILGVLVRPKWGRFI